MTKIDSPDCGLRLLTEDTMRETLPPRVEQLRAELAERIPCYPSSPGHRHALREMPFGELLSTYVQWAQRLIRPAARLTSYAPDFWTARAKASASAIRGLEAKIALGEDLSPHLSARALSHGHPSYSAVPRGRGIPWDRMDMALNAWGIHHLHLRPGRSSELLFVSCHRDQVTFLFLGDHKSFHSGELEEAVVTWRARTGAFELKGISPSLDEHTHAERTALARYGISTAASVDGKAIMSSLLSTAGTSVRSGILADRISLSLREFDARLDAHLLTDLIPAKHLLRLRGREWSWHMEYCDLVLLEVATPIKFVMVAGPT